MHTKYRVRVSRQGDKSPSSTTRQAALATQSVIGQTWQLVVVNVNTTTININDDNHQQRTTLTIGIHLQWRLSTCYQGSPIKFIKKLLVTARQDRSSITSLEFCLRTRSTMRLWVVDRGYISLPISVTRRSTFMSRRFRYLPPRDVQTGAELRCLRP